jgi:hypothetical protein
MNPRMHANRLLFARPLRKLRLAPIYMALSLLASVSLAGFAVALWPQDPVPSASRPADSDAAPASRSFEGGMRVLPHNSREPAGRRTWM